MFYIVANYNLLLNVKPGFPILYVTQTLYPRNLYLVLLVNFSAVLAMSPNMVKVLIWEIVFCSCLFWRFLSPNFSERVKTFLNIWPVWISFTFLGKRRPTKYCLWKVKLVCFMVICSVRYLFWKSLKRSLRSRQFLWRIQK